MYRSLMMAVTAGVFFAMPAAADNVVFAHGYSAQHPMTLQGFEPFVACVQEGTQGAVAIDSFPSGQLVTMKNAIDGLSSGIAGLSAVLVGQESAKLPLNGITLLPDMGMTATEMVHAWRTVLDQGGPLSDEIAQQGLHPLLVNFLPAYQVMSTRGATQTLDDFKGLKVRVSGGAMNLTANELQAVPVELDVDMYVALQRGVIDATFLALTSAKTYSVQELIKATSANGSFGSGTSILAMSDAAWDRLTPDQQQVFTECGLRIEGELAAYLDGLNEEVKTEFNGLGIDVFDYTDGQKAELSKRFAAVAEAYFAQLGPKGDAARAAYEDYQAELRK